MKAYVNYCFTHKKDLCDDCLNLHIDFKVRDYNLMDPNIKQLKENLNLMDKNINIHRIKNENITRILLEALREFKGYHYIAKDIIGKYELFNNDLKNYTILKSPRNLKFTNNKINKELIDVINEQDTPKRTNSLFKITEIQEGISKKGEKFDYSKDNNDDWLEEISKNEKNKSPTDAETRKRKE